MDMESSNQKPLLESRPGIFVIGSSNVGKRTLLSRLLSVDIEDAFDSSSPEQVFVHGWTIDTKYYTADVSVWMADLNDKFSIKSLPIHNHLNALVMVFDLSELTTLSAIQEWVSSNDIGRFDILLCIGNKVDLVPGHPVHAPYRRLLQKVAESSSADPCAIDEFGILETEGACLLGNGDEEEEGGDEQSASDVKRSCTEWCSEHNIEYIEACASNTDFDKCLSVDGDSQGVERVFGALSAHMWPGMVLKSGDKITEPSLPNKEGITEPSLPKKEELSEEESDYELEYEVLSRGSAEPRDDTDGGWTSANGTSTELHIGRSVTHDSIVKSDTEKGGESDTNLETSVQKSKDDEKVAANIEENTETNEVAPFDFEDLEQLMSEIGNMRNSLRLMPDFQRREMAANLALKMAAMFGGGSDDEERFD